MATEDDSNRHMTFDFPMMLQLTLPLDFTLPASEKYEEASPGHRKRRRQSCEISLDELVLPSSKKRRLRLILVTSRLSRPFSTPASHIADPGGSRVALFSRIKSNSKVRGRSLRRAAVVNLHRRNSLGSDNGTSPNAKAWRDWNQRISSPFQLLDPALEEDVRGEANVLRQEPSMAADISKTTHGPSNYEALDQWEAYFVLGDEQGDDSQECRSDASVSDRTLDNEEGEVVAMYDFNCLQTVVDPSHGDNEDEYEDIWAARLPSDWYEEKTAI